MTHEIPNSAYDALLPGDFSGAASVRRGGEPVYVRARGFRQLTDEMPNTPDTRFPTASAGKAFVAAAVLRFVERGLLRLDSRLADLVDFDLHGIDPDITLEQLLSHTSGIPDYFDESVMDDYAELWLDLPCYRMRRSADLVPLFADKPMMYPRGERFQYNNTGYVVLGLILERLTGRPFDEVLRDEVFLPAGMPDTGYYELDRLPANCANAYIKDEARGGWYTNIFSVEVKGTGAGGAFTTAGDIGRFWDALTGGILLAPDTLAAMLTPHGGDDEDDYGLGVWLRRPDGAPYIQGCDPGVSFLSLRDPARGLDVTLLSNFGDNVWRIARAMTAAEND